MKGHIKAAVFDFREAVYSYEILYAAEELTSGYSHRGMVSGTSFMAEARPQLQRGLDAMAAAKQVWCEAFLIDGDELQVAWKEVFARREYLDSYVMPRIIEVDVQSHTADSILRIGAILEERAQLPDWTIDRADYTAAKADYAVVRDAAASYSWGLKNVSPESVVASIESIILAMEAANNWLDWYTNFVDEVRVLRGISV